MSRAGGALLLAHTVRHLRPAQVAHRARLRLQKQVLHRWPEPLARRWHRPPQGPVGWPVDFEALDGRLPVGPVDAEQASKGAFRFLNEERSLGEPPDWTQAEASQLWRYHLHYLEWAWSFVAHPDRGWARDTLLRLWRSWRSGTVFGRWDAWSPYVAAVRSWALCGVFAPLVAGSADEPDVIDSLARHAGFVRHNLELDVGGNHLVKNLKALVGLGVFLGDGELLRLGIHQLERELQVQVLADGGHFERSPSYHCQVLGDLIDVSGLLHAAGERQPSGLDAAIAAMRRWLGEILLPDGDVPPFNDAVRLGADRLALLEPAPATGRLSVLADSGYIVVRPSPRLHLVADVGLPCPPELPAHAHADCLSFELCVDGCRLIVDTGTSTYAPGPRRRFERSTAAHNTVTVDDADQTEVWGTFRAARRATPTLESATDADGVIEIIASHDGYERLSGRPRHRRRWTVSGDRVVIEDEVSGRGEHEVAGRLHVASPSIDAIDTTTVRTGSTVIEFGGDVEMHDADVATGHGVWEPAACFVTRKVGLPAKMLTKITLEDS